LARLRERLAWWAADQQGHFAAAQPEGGEDVRWPVLMDVANVEKTPSRSVLLEGLSAVEIGLDAADYVESGAFKPEIEPTSSREQRQSLQLGSASGAAGRFRHPAKVAHDSSNCRLTRCNATFAFRQGALPSDNTG
jgi:hypothetical protein